ncbi:beta-lactamase regulating signal transducer with metallopeptidase domain [Flavobacterium sp. 1]|uniref:M56 family metallopeptidase n=1 Tax=Flavobacterium sp. 1 TaxID=2035200 RepID=UPI000CC12060|nr:M56 family metallopeptidase [Flavobacterium sp. 1]PJJ10518.1 beta-lactamase regulating signal transducer with metallopeptidase domain [Flavobacterium sp. 1]
MIDFLFKSSISLLALLLFYHLVLEKEKMHRFNRFYLLFSIVFSFVIPFITIEVIDESSDTLVQTNTVMTGTATMVTVQETTNHTTIIVWSIYGLITLLLLFRFMKNILKINSKIKSNTIIDYKNAKLVLLKEKTLLHTFWNSIFINETDYHNRKIEAELYTHELIHVTQKHTLDILFIEILKTLFWFNPIFIFYKKAIQLNHEFLADEQVVNAHNDVPFYQNLLLSKANENQPFYLTSNLNYSVAKKRLIMMTKTVSKTKIILYKIALLPLFSGLIFFICVESVAQEKSVSSKSNTQTQKSITQPVSKDKLRDAYYAGVQIIVKDNNKRTIIDKKYEELTLAEKNRFLNYVPSPKIKKTPTEKEFNNWKNEKNFAIWLDEKNIPNSELNQYSTKDIAYFSGSFIYKNARTKKHPQLHQFHLYTHSYFDENLKDSHLKFSGKELRITVMDKKQKKAQPTETKPIKIQENEIHNLAQISDKPEFPGGIEKFYQFVGTNFKTPSEPNLKGKVYITFIIEKDGSLSDFKILRDIGYGTGDEAIRVLKLSPKWIPGKIDGNPVKVMYSLPITIQSAN